MRTAVQITPLSLFQGSLLETYIYIFNKQISLFFSPYKNDKMSHFFFVRKEGSIFTIQCLKIKTCVFYFFTFYQCFHAWKEIGRKQEVVGEGKKMLSHPILLLHFFYIFNKTMGCQRRTTEQNAFAAATAVGNCKLFFFLSSLQFLLTPLLFFGKKISTTDIDRTSQIGRQEGPT